MTGKMLLHIGTPKTGTSSIQVALAGAQSTGALGNACYPTPGGDPYQAKLVNLYLPYERMTRATRTEFPSNDHRLAAALGRYRRTFFGMLQAADNAIACTDNLSLLSVDEVRRLKGDLVAAGFSDFQVVLYVRDPADYYVSQLQQNLKASGHVTDPRSFRYRFRQIATTWEELLPGRVVVRRYHSALDFDVLQDFAGLLDAFLGVSLPTDSARLNTTISAEGMDVLQRYRATFWNSMDNVFMPDSNRLVAFLQQCQTDLPQTAPRLKPDIATWIRHSHRQDAEFLAARYGVDVVAKQADSTPTAPVGSMTRIADVLDHIDGEVVIEILLRLGKSGLEQGPPRRSLARRVASRLLR